MEELKKKARELLKDKEVELIIGYGAGIDEYHTTPIFVENEEEAEGLLWNQYCVQNLSVYLYDTPLVPSAVVYRQEFKEVDGRNLPVLINRKIGLVAKGCDIRATIELIKEKQIRRGDVVIIAMTCNGMKKPDGGFYTKCYGCKVNNPTTYDYLIGSPQEALVGGESYDKLLESFEAKTPREKKEFWDRYLSRCIRCYACRNICPVCYCKQCTLEETMPQWVGRPSTLNNNRMFHLIREFHVAGRCVGCGECTRVCPMDIPLYLLVEKNNREIKELFNYEAGMDLEGVVPLANFKPDDVGDFIK